MRRGQLFFAVLAAITGIGVAYASQPRDKATAYTYRWHTVNHKIVFTVSIVIAFGRCPPGVGATCLIGTSAAAPTVILQGTFQ
jgi:hypothetical protein